MLTLTPPRIEPETTRQRRVPGRRYAGARLRTMAKTVALLDYGSGNLRSAQRAVERVGAEVTVASDPQTVLAADGLLVVERLHALVLPHMGWNTVQAPENSQMFAGFSSTDRFYFVHSYGVRDWVFEGDDLTTPPLVTWAQHDGDRFVAAVENGPLWATQFHPEKSGEMGLKLLENWVGSL